MANPMGAKANYTRSAANFHNTNNGLGVFKRSGAESFGSSFGSFSIAFRFTPASTHSRSRPESAKRRVPAARCRTCRRGLGLPAGNARPAANALNQPGRGAHDHRRAGADREA
ncbi:hypothetical protein, partial [Burkholderia territorii]|uniref:hypothetical protein n=1 Tax=Burkholderia territorii TaxID=1503055 RepID=UPI001C9D5022